MKIFTLIRNVALISALFLVFSNDAFAQLQRVIGTSTSSPTWVYGPIYRSSTSSGFDYSRHSHLYLANELNIDSGSTIQKIEWFKTSTSQTNGPGTFAIYMANNDSTALITGSDWLTEVIAGATQVYNNPAQTVGDSTGWTAFDISAFTYTGNSLQISMEWDISGVVGNPTDGSFPWRWTSAPDLGIGNASSSPVTVLNTATYGNARPNIRITYTAPPSDDAGVSSIISPTLPLSTGTQNFDVIVSNFGGSPLGSANVYGEIVNLVTLTSTTFGPIPLAVSLGLGESDTVSLGSFNFTSGTYSVTAWTGQPNGNPVDNNTSNDTSSIIACTPLAGGAYTIDAGAAASGTNFQSFNDAVDALINCGGISGAVTFDVAPGSGPYNERVLIPAIAGASATNTITFNGNGEEITETSPSSSSANNYVIRLNGADHITLNDLVVSAGTGTTFTNYAVHLTAGTDSCSITNCTINNDTTTTSSAKGAIVISGSLTSQFTDETDGTPGLTITGNTITGGYAGVFFNGPSSFTPTATSPGLVISNNTIRAAGFYGIRVEGAEAAIVSQNDISSFGLTTGADGIYFDNVVGDFLISRNTVRNIGDAGIFLTQVNDLSSGLGQVINNMIGGGFTSTFTTYGIYCSNCDSVAIIYNSVLVDGGSTTASHALFDASTSTSTGLTILNNSLANTAGGVAFELNNINALVDLNNNNYFTTGTDLVEYGNLVLYQDLNGLQGDTLGPANHDNRSREGDPGYVSSTDLHATGAQLNMGANNLTGINIDIDGELRDASFPDIGADEYTPPTEDAGATALASPVSGCVLGAAETITITITNLGSDQLNSGSSVPVSYTINGGTTVNENFVLPVNLPPTQSLDYSFTATADLSAIDTFDIVVTAASTPDGNASNDAFAATVIHFPAIATPVTYDLEGENPGFIENLNNGWTASPTTGYRWEMEDATGANENSFGTGPFFDHTNFGTPGGIYAYTEASSGSSGAEATLTSPCIDLSGLVIPAFEFWYHMFGSDINVLYIDVNGGSGWVETDSIFGPQQTAGSDPYLLKTVDLSAYVGATVQLRYRAIRGASFGGDISIDDLRIYDGAVPEVEVVSIDFPTGSQCDLTAAESIEVTLANNGLLPATGFDITAEVTGANNVGPVTFTYTDTLAPQSSATYNFPPIDFSAVGTYDITVYVNEPADLDNSNDTATALASNSISPAAPLSTTNDTVGFNGTPVSGTVTAVSAADGIIWYDSATGGNIVGAGDTLVTPPVSGTTCFYAASSTIAPTVEALANQGDCSAGEAKIIVTVDPASFPDEIQWSLEETASGTVIFQSPCGFYTPGQTTMDTFCLNTGLSYTFRAYDDWGDGWNGGTYSIDYAVTGSPIAGGGVPSASPGGDASVNCIFFEELAAEFQFADLLCTSNTRLAACVTVDTVDCDLGIVGIVSPNSGCGLGAAESITVALQNFGDQPQAGFDISYTISVPGDTAPSVVVTETYAPSIAPGTVDTISFATPANLDTANTYTITAFTILGCDFDSTNNSTTKVVVGEGEILYPVNEDFETFITGFPGTFQNGWSISPTTGFRWQVDNGGTGSTATGPAVDNTTGTSSGIYIYTEASSGSAGAEATLVSPCIDLTGANIPTLEYASHLFGSDIVGLNVDVQVNGIWLNNIDTIVGQTQTSETDAWSLRTVPLTDYLNQIIKIRFRVVRGPSFAGDVAVDDVRIFDAAVPDVGVASIDAPVSACQLSASETIQLTLQNTTAFLQSSVPLTVIVTNDGAPVATINETIGGIPPGSVGYTVGTTVDMSGPGTYNIVAYTSLGTDGDNSNDTAFAEIVTRFAIPFLEDFEAESPGNPLSTSAGLLTNGWEITNSTNSTFGYRWEVEDATGANENSTNTGPFFDHTNFGTPGGIYLYTEASSGSFGDVTSVTSPCLDLGGAITPTLSFWYHAFGADINELHVDLVTDTGNINDIIPAIIGAQQTAQADPYINVLIDLSSYVGTAVQVRFRAIRGGSFAGDWAIDDINLFDGGVPDLSVQSILTPTNSCGGSATETVSIVVCNTALLTVAGYNVAYDITGPIASSGTQAVADSLASGDCDTITFTTTADLSVTGTYTVTASVTAVGDVNQANDTASTDVSTGNTSPYSEDFEGETPGNPNGSDGTGTLNNGWTVQTANGSSFGYRWEVEDASGANENSFGTGPFFDHTTFGTPGGIYMYTEASSGSAGDTALLVSPCIDLTGLASPIASFWYHGFGASLNELHFDVLSGGVWINDVAPALIGAQMDSQSQAYNQAIAGLACFSGEVVQFRFRAIRGASFDGDWAIDDFFVGDGVQPPVDIAITDIVSPTTGCGLSNSEQVIVTLRNNSCTDIPSGAASIYLEIEGPINSSLPFAFPVNASIPAFSQINYNLGIGANVSLPGTYTITGSVTVPTDVNQSNDTLSEEFVNLANVSAFPYTESFEGLNSTWSAGGSLSTWALGTPNKPVIQGASDGINAWVNGGLDSSLYNNNEQSFVQGPCFDMFNLPSAEIIMDVWWETEFSWDGAVLQSSIDAGETWQDVGSFGDPDWYTDGTISGLSWASSAQDGWSGRTTTGNGSNGWVTVRHELDFLAGEPLVYLRIAFGADGSVQGEGFAFDNVIVREIPPADLGVVAITSPDDGCGIGSEEITVVIQNFGFNTLIAPADVALAVQVDSGMVARDTVTVTGNLGSGDTTSLTFNTTADLSAIGSYLITVWTEQAEDGEAGNDTATAIVSNLLIPDEPTTTSLAVACDGEGSAVLSASSNGEIYIWYDTATGGTPLAVADTFITPTISANTTFYVEAATGALFTVGPQDNTLGTGSEYTFFADGLVFDVFEELTIDEVTVYPTNAGDVVINIETSTGALVGSVTATVAGGGVPTTIPVGITVTPGNDYEMNAAGTTTGSLFRNTGGAAYPYVGGSPTPFMEITGAINNLSGFYYFFYNWQVSAVACRSARVPVTAIVSPTITTSIVGTDVTTTGGSDGTANLTPGGGIPPYTYLWSNGATTQDVTGLASGGYFVTVTDLGGCTQVDSVNINEPAGCSPSASVTNTQTTGITTNQATFSWNPLSGTNTYQVRYAIVGGGFTTVSVPGTQNTYTTPSNLQPGTTYQWQVRALCNVTGTIGTAFTALLQFTTQGAGCTKPVGLMSTVTDDDVLLQWTAVPGATSYTINGGPVSDPTAVTLQVGNVTSFAVNNLTRNITYAWRVRATCGPATSTFSAFNQFFIPPLICVTPDTLFSQVTGNSVVLNWNPSQGAIGYTINGGPVSAPTAVFLDVPGGGVSSFQVNNLNAGSYGWRIRAVCQLSPQVVSTYTGFDQFTIVSPPAKASEGLFGDLGATDGMNVQMYPNPTSGNVNFAISNASADDIVIELYDLNGRRMVAEQTKGENQRIVMNTDQLSNGIYQVMIKNGSTVKVEKLIIAR